MANATLDVEFRTQTGKGAARRLRRSGKVPAVLYGSSVEPVQLAVAASAVQRLLQSGGTTGLLELRYDGKSQVALVKEIQTDPARGTPLHVDFHAVALDQEVQVAVPLGVLSEEMRTRDGGIISLNLRELSVYCLPTQIPESITIDVSGLGIGDSITAGQLPLPEGVRLAGAEDEVVVSVIAPQRESVPASQATEESDAAQSDAGAEADAEDKGDE